MLGGVEGGRTEGQILGQTLLCAFSLQLSPRHRRKGRGVWDMAERGGRMLHKPEAIQEQLPVAWKHLCDSRHWERRCKYIRIYAYINVCILHLLRTTPSNAT